MAAIGERVVVGVTAVELVPKGMRAIVTNRDDLDSCDLGGSGVTAGAGAELKPGETVKVDAYAEPLFAIRSAAADVDIHVLAIRSVR